MATALHTPPPAPTPTRILLESQRDRLRDVLNTGCWATIVARDLGERYLTRITSALKQTDLGLEANKGLYGRHGWAPGVEDAIRSIRFQHDLTLTAKQDAAAAKRMVA